MRKMLLVSTMVCTSVLMSCQTNTKKTDETTIIAKTDSVIQSDMNDVMSQGNVVQVAIESKDHSTLVAALKAADLVATLSKEGPFTVFAPTNTGFNKLPAGTLDNLLKPENKGELTNILQYHVSMGVFKYEDFIDGQIIGQINGNDVKMSVKNGKVMINGATVVASAPASNGIVHVIDGVLLPPPSK
jgi:uncharacterized surface protein with fasciclin (FAS1) repeats